ncbi:MULTISPECIES: DUF6276 family protein [Salinibaculum]|uniref:DUF6276 family protein n=1 Tax=Salinibaculum TaxID=2732368 RepID=UPI0030CF8DC6
MDCPDCGAETLSFPVPTELREFLPGDEPGAALCTRCLSLHPVADPPADQPDFQQVSTAFPGNTEAAVPMALLVGLLENLALYRAEISDLLARVEQAGTDPLLVLDRLSYDEAIDADVDLAGRRTQLEQLL